MPYTTADGAPLTLTLALTITLIVHVHLAPSDPDYIPGHDYKRCR